MFITCVMKQVSCNNKYFSTRNTFKFTIKYEAAFRVSINAPFDSCISFKIISGRIITIPLIYWGKPTASQVMSKLYGSLADTDTALGL